MSETSSAQVLAGPMMTAGRYAPSLLERLRSQVSRLRHRYFPPKSSLETFAERELARLSGDPDDDMQAEMNRHLLQMVRTFAREGHSGFSAGYAVSILQKLLRYEPLTPLTGDDAEWMQVGSDDEPWWQNTRCSHVFRDADGRAYDLNGKVFVEPSGAAFTSRESRVFVTFPYTPKTEYVRVQTRDQRGRFVGHRQQQDA